MVGYLDLLLGLALKSCSKVMLQVPTAFSRGWMAYRLIRLARRWGPVSSSSSSSEAGARRFKDDMVGWETREDRWGIRDSRWIESSSDVADRRRGC